MRLWDGVTQTWDASRWFGFGRCTGRSVFRYDVGCQAMGKQVGRELTVSKELEYLLNAAREREMTEKERELQRVSFAYGNTHFENELITKHTVTRAAEELRAEDAKDGRSAG